MGSETSRICGFGEEPHPAPTPNANNDNTTAGADKEGGGGGSADQTETDMVAEDAATPAGTSEERQKLKKAEKLVESTLSAALSSPSAASSPPDVVRVRALLSLFSSHSSDTDVIQCSLLALLNLTQQALQHVIINEGGHAATIDVMKKHQQRQLVQQYGCGVLWTLCANAEHEARICEAGGVSCVVFAMNAFPEAPQLQRMAAGALHHFAHNPATRSEVASSGALAALLSCMSSSLRESTDVMEPVSLALTSLADDASCKKLISSQQGIERIVDIMRLHPRHLHVQQNAVVALHSLCYQNTDNKLTAHDCGAIECIVDAMRNHGDAPSFLHRACGLLWNLTCQSNANKLTVANKNGIEAILTAMKTHPDNQAIQREACGALRNISAIDENKTKVASKAAISALVAAMQRHPNSYDIQEQACVVLYNVAINTDVMAIMIEEGVLEAILTSVRTHANVPAVQLEGFGVMTKLARAGLAQKRDPGPNPETIALATLAARNFPDHKAYKFATGTIQAWNNPTDPKTPKTPKTAAAKTQSKPK